MSLLKRTDQLWKLYLFLVLMALGAAITLFQPLLRGRFDEKLTTSLVIGGMLLLMCVFAWAVTFITCPNCNHKLFWHAVIKEGLGGWFAWLIDVEKCPQCGSKDGATAPVRRRGKSKGER